MQSGARCEFPLACLSSHNPLSGSIFVTSLRWTVLPKMSNESCWQSALFIGNGDDDAAVLIVGGDNGNGHEAAVRVSLGAPFIWPCATSKQKA